MREPGRQIVHLHVAGVADHQFALAVEHAQALRHVVEGGIEAEVLPLQLLLLQEKLALLRLHLLQGVVEGGERQAAEAVVGGNAEQQEGDGDVERWR